MVFLLCFIPSTCISQEFVRQGNTITYRGNKFEIDEPPRYYSIMRVDRDHPEYPPDTTKIYSFDSTIMRMNGEHVYDGIQKIHPENKRLFEPIPKNNKSPFELFILRSFAKEFNKLPDGIYYLNIGNIIIDKTGKMVYYEYSGLSDSNPNTDTNNEDDGNVQPKTPSKVPLAIEQSISKMIDSFMNTIPTMIPGKLNGKNINYRTGIYTNKYKIKVKNHKAIFIKTW